MGRKKGMDYMWLALTAFLGLGMEALLAFLAEPLIYGRPIRNGRRERAFFTGY